MESPEKFHVPGEMELLLQMFQYIHPELLSWRDLLRGVDAWQVVILQLDS